MRKILLVLSLLWFPFNLLAQEESEKELSRLSSDLEIGHVFQWKNNSVEFLKVISDSRCPKQVLCIWAGEAKVLLGINLDGNYFEKEVVVSGGGSELALTENLQIQISHLRPYPETGSGIAPEEYCLRFGAITREEN